MRKETEIINSGVRIDDPGLVAYVTDRKQAFGGNFNRYIRHLIEKERAEVDPESHLVSLENDLLRALKNQGFSPEIVEKEARYVALSSPKVALFPRQFYDPGKGALESAGQFLAVKNGSNPEMIVVVLPDTAGRNSILNWRSLRTVAGLENLQVSIVSGVAELLGNRL